MNKLKLKKGSSKQKYPSSQMGSIALLKQAYFDYYHFIESKKENLAASFGGIPKYIHIEMVEPDLEIPGIIAIACAIPTMIDEENEISFWLFLNLFDKIKSIPVEHKANPTKWTLSNILKK